MDFAGLAEYLFILNSKLLNMRRICNLISFQLICIMLFGMICGFFASRFENSVIRYLDSETCMAAPGGNGSFIYKVVEEDVAYSKRVYLGGQPVGFNLDLNGVMVVEFNEVDTPVGFARLKSKLKVGDVIEKIEGVSVENSEDIIKILNLDKDKQSFVFSVDRGGEKINFSVNPLIDRVSGEYRLGISVKNEIGGIGTVTYIKQDGRFAALGHSVGAGGSVDVSGGDVYGCKIIGLEKGVKGRAGSIKGMLDKKKHLGVVDKNIRYGIYGNLDEAAGQLYDVGGREEIVCGRAQLCSAISGKSEFYDIEIVKTAYQESDGEKGMVVKITDKRLIALTGGIVQGMSGSPIIQNDKLVGALTHVFVNDPQRGYGIYLDWMLNN